MIGAPQPLVLAKPAAIDTAQAARYFGARGEPDDRTMTLLETCAMPLLAAATPRAVWLEADTAALAEAGILRGGDCDEASGKLPAGGAAGRDPWPRRGCTDPPCRCGRYRGGRCVRRTGQRALHAKLVFGNLKIQSATVLPELNCYIKR